MKTSSRFKTALFWGGFVLIFALIPVLMTSTYQMNLASHILIWGLFATSFNMLWGTTGMLSFGQALYFGMGAYCVGLMVKYLGSVWFFPGMLLGLVLSIVIAYLVGKLVIRVGRGLFYHAHPGSCPAGMADYV